MIAVARAFGGQGIVASAMGISLSQFKRYAAGENQPTFESVSNLSLDLGVRLEWLASGQGSMMADDKASVSRTAEDDVELSSKDAELIISCFIAVTELLDESNVVVERDQKIVLAHNMFRREKARLATQNEERKASLVHARVENHS
ncbi:MAG TPA: hypothetical protein VGV37_06855 [Aliidongia sp.]|nr:hypothetical protein [Aliidongia sp.]